MAFARGRRCGTPAGMSRAWFAVWLGLFGCGDDPAPANTVAFELAAPLAGETFWDLPFPSDLRLTAEGRPDLAGFPNPRKLPIVAELLASAAERRGFSTMPHAWFRFTGAPPSHALDQVFAAEPGAAALLVDIDPASPERGAQYPVVAATLADDAFAGPGLVAIAPRPGIVLAGDTRYAIVLRRAFAPDAAPPTAFADLARGRGPAAAVALYQPLWSTLAALGIAPADVLVATVFTTGDEVALLRARSEEVRAAAVATIRNLVVDPVDGADHAGYCELVGEVELPQYQTGAPPFDRDGLFVLDASGAPTVQGTLTVPLRLTLPAATMPTGGWPLWQFFHGSGGAAFDLADDGPSATADGEPAIGEGPGAVVARRGLAAAAAALPLNPERLPGASNYAYLNLNHLAVFPYTFQQGVFEQRLLLDALLALEIPPATVAACAGLALPATATAHHFDAGRVTAGGHSMGGMYANMIGAVEPRYGALTAFGAGGFWNLMILDTEIVPGARDLLGGVIGVDSATLTYAHPVMGLINLGWEIAEPGASMARLARRPLPGLPARHVYQPVGRDDKFFPNAVFDAAALAYGNHEAGDIVWPGTQDALRSDQLDGLRAYPVRANRAASATTGVVVQYADDGLLDAHYIHRQLPAVRYQYGCFLASYVRDGVPSVPAPAADPDAPCP